MQKLIWKFGSGEEGRIRRQHMITQHLHQLSFAILGRSILFFFTWSMFSVANHSLFCDAIANDIRCCEDGSETPVGMPFMG